MKKFLAGFLTASCLFLYLLYSIKMPEYLTYDCSKLHMYADVPEHVFKACFQKEERDPKKWL